jgi:hypothetical protein
MRGRSWNIVAFLWICPIAAIGIFVSRVLTAQALRPPQGYQNYQWFYVPGAPWLALTMGAVLVSALIACLTRRLLGFLAGSSFVVLVLAGAGWTRNHWISDTLNVSSGQSDGSGPAYRDWCFISRTGGMRLCYLCLGEGKRAGNYRFSNLEPGGRRTINHWSGRFESGAYMAPEAFGKTPQWLRHLGFSVAIKPTEDWDANEGGVVFEIVLPYYFFCLVTMALPLAWTIRQRRRHRASGRAATGACKVCGYDLRATPDPAEPICPECGFRT